MLKLHIVAWQHPCMTSRCGKKHHLTCCWQHIFETISVCSLSDVFYLTSSQISDSALHHWKELVAKCMTEYRSSECNKPDNKKLVWIVSRRTAQNLQASHFSVPGLPTIPEGSWDESERLIIHFHFLNLPACCFSWLKTRCCDAEIMAEWSFLNVSALVLN